MLEKIKNLFRRGGPEVELNVKFAPVTPFDAGFKQLGLPKARSEVNFGDAASNIAWVYIANTIISETAAMLPLQMFRTASKIQTPITQGYQYGLLSHPNAFTSQMEMLQAIFGSLGYSGNAYLLIDREKNRLWVLRPEHVSIIADIDNFISGYVYRPLNASQPQYFTTADIVHIKTYNPQSYFYGLSPVQAAWAQVGFLNSDEIFWKSFWNEGGRLFGIFTTEGVIDKTTLERMKEQAKQAFGGAKKMAANIFIDKGFKFQQIGVSQKDAQLLDKYGMSRDEILACFKIPNGVAGVIEGQTYNTMETQLKLFYQNAIKPKLALVENALSNHPVMGANNSITYKFDLSSVDVLKADELHLVSIADKAVDGGLMTQNEARIRYLKMDPIDGGDILKPLNAVANPTLALNTATSTLATSATHMKQIEAEIQTIEAEIRLIEGQKDMPPVNMPRKPMESMRTKDQRDVIAKSYDAKLQPHDEKLATKMKGVFKDQNETVQKNLRKMLKNHGSHYLKKDQTDDMMNGLGGYDKIIEEALANSSSDVIDEFGALSVEEIRKLLPDSSEKDPVWDFTDPRIAKYIKARSIEMSGLINDTTSADVRAVIVNSLAENGGDLRLVSQDIAAYFKSAEGYRAMRVARTETGAAAQEAIDTSYQLNSDIVVGKEWVTARDEQVRDSHQIDGLTVALEDTFILNDGAECMYPMDDSLDASDVINCRCTTVPVV